MSHLYAIQGLGLYSSLTFLDVSDNQIGLDPNGKPNSEGISFLSNVLIQSTNLRSLALARNFLRDEDAILIARQIQGMPQFEDLDFR